MNTLPAEKKPDEPAPQVPAVADAHAKALDTPRRRAPRDTGIANIATAIADITSEVGIISKEGYNRFHGYKFAQMQDVLQKLTPLLAKHGIVIVQTEIGRSMFDDDRVVAVQYEFTIAHRSGEVWPDRPKQTGVCRCRDSKGGWDDKALNKAHTAARKYFLLALFQIATGDEDADENGDGAHKPRPPAENVIRKSEPRAADRKPVAAQEPASAVPASSTAEAEPQSLEEKARTAAGMGYESFRVLWRNCSPAEQEELRPLLDELRKVWQKAEAKKEDDPDGHYT